MKNLFPLFIITIFLSCSKQKTTQTDIPVPNGDFENWDNTLLLSIWETNSCPTCVPPYETYIVQKDNTVFNGQFAAKFIYNNVYAAWAKNTFFVSQHPTILSAYVKCNISTLDTVSIKIDLFTNNSITDSGSWIGTSQISNYTKIDIPITQNSQSVDSATIKIVAGNKSGTELWVDNLKLTEN